MSTFTFMDVLCSQPKDEGSRGVMLRVSEGEPEIFSPVVTSHCLSALLMGFFCSDFSFLSSFTLIPPSLYLHQVSGFI